MKRGLVPWGPESLRTGALLAVFLSALTVIALRLSRPRFIQAEPATVPRGFTPESFAAEQHWERRFLSLPDPRHCSDYAWQLTREPHVAGTPGDRRVVNFIYNEFERDGLRPEIVEYNVLLSYPKSIAVELVKPEEIKLANPEPVLPGDPDTRVSDPIAKMPWNGYSPSADLTAPVVYANYGNAEDYEQLAKLGVDVRGKVVLVRYFHGYRGGKSLEAERRNAAGVLIYSDPAEDGAAQGKTYPDGPWGPPGHLQRGAVVYDFEVPGDPLTPGWASTPGAKRIAESEARILPRIPMAPLSAADAAEILKRLKGPAAPKGWVGGLPLRYRLGDGKVKVHLALDMERRITPIWNVIGKITGSKEPEKLVILGNHHDAWVYGAVDPSSGSATMLETARALGLLLKEGFRPRRTIVLGSWDAEEYTLTGSTEWGEEHEAELRKDALVCLNVDASTSGRNFSPSLTPALLPALIEATRAVRDPATGRTIYDNWKNQPQRGNVRSYAVPSASGGPTPYGVLGGGSDFMVFLQHDGVPSLDMIFDGPYGVYHSLYDDYNWMSRYGDPAFVYHAVMCRLWGLLALRFADADVVPLDYAVSAGEITAYLQDLEKITPAEFYASKVQPLIEQCREWRRTAATLNERLEEMRVTGKSGNLEKLNAALMAEERALLADGGIPGRPWFRHLIYAPLPSYEAETLPGLREALEARKYDVARAQADEIGKAISRATQTAASGNW